MARKRGKLLELSSYELKHEVEKENLFDDEYGDNQRADILIYEEIEALKVRTFFDKVKLGRNILELLGDEPTHKKLKEVLAKTEISIKHTQAIKYIEVYNYMNKKFSKNQSTENLERMGIEKAYLLTTVKDCWKQEKLEKFIIDNVKSVDELQKLVKILNKKCKVFELAVSFLSDSESSNQSLNVSEKSNKKPINYIEILEKNNCVPIDSCNPF